ncbi:MAG: hypothetical protein JOZ93_10170 [Sinobacteraceae bacterium]|nr:hypothetical protein [Nevskiaceae bacterium]
MDHRTWLGSWRNPGIMGSALLYLAALLTPALRVDSGVVASGSTLLLHGWRGLADGYVEWLANPLLLLGWLAVVRRWLHAAFALGLAALGLMLLFLGRGPLHWASQPGTHVVHRAVGFWLWVASAACVLYAAGCSLLPAGKAQILRIDRRDRQR